MLKYFEVLFNSFINESYLRYFRMFNVHTAQRCIYVIISALFRFRIIVKLGFYVFQPALTFKDLPKYESLSSVDTGLTLLCNGNVGVLLMANGQGLV